MWKVLLWSLMRRYIDGYGMRNARKALCTKAFDEKERSKQAWNREVGK